MQGIDIDRVGNDFKIATFMKRGCNFKLSIVSRDKQKKKVCSLPHKFVGNLLPRTCKVKFNFIILSITCPAPKFVYWRKATGGD